MLDPVGNDVHDSGDATMAMMMERLNADVSDNVFEDNKYGIRMSVGCADNVFSDNLITGSTRYASISAVMYILGVWCGFAQMDGYGGTHHVCH